MTKTELEKQIKELEEKQAELEKQINDLKQKEIEESLRERWKPEYNETYYFIASDRDICHVHWRNDEVDNWRYLIGNIFKTEQEAEEHKKKIEIQARFKNFVEEHTKELDWNNEEEEKYSLAYSYIDKLIYIEFNLEAKRQGRIYASSKQILKDAIAEIGEENIKKYVLEVEE